MAGRKYRITIGLKASEYNALKRMNELNGVPMAKTVSELVEAVTPVLSRMADNIEKVKLVDENIKRHLRDSADKSLVALEELRIQALQHMDLFSEDMESFLSDHLNTNTAITPPPSNTGVRSSKKNKVG